MITKTETKQFQYDIQTYQEDCVNNIVSLFDSLRQKQNFGDVLTAHHKKNKYDFPVQDTKNIDIMMETGTGKTFTFTKSTTSKTATNTLIGINLSSKQLQFVTQTTCHLI